jgi:F0F1-type ATP synthase membrane subunit b/b'
MSLDPGISIVVSFIGFFWIFIKKIYPLATKTIDEHIELVKNQISEAESLKNNASLALKEAYARKNEAVELIEKNRRESNEKIKRLRQENEEYLKTLRERFESSLKNQLEAELARQKELLMEKLSDQLIKKLKEKVESDDCDVSSVFSREDLKKLL